MTGREKQGQTGGKRQVENKLVFVEVFHPRNRLARTHGGARWPSERCAPGAPLHQYQYTCLL